MKTFLSTLIASFLFTVTLGFGQKIVYSEPDRDDARTLNFEVVGKLGGKFLIYKN